MLRFLLLLLFPLVANAATFWSFDWETLPTGNSNEAEGIFYQGNCFEKALGDPFNSIELSTKYVRTGSKSARLYTDSKYANAQGHRNCASMYKTETITVNGVTYLKHRQEPKYAYSGTNSLPDFRNYQVGEERWFRYSFYFPSDEGTFAHWNTGPYASKGIMIMQIFAQGGASGGTHEVAFILSGGPKMKVELVYGTKADEEIHKSLGTFNLKKDAWNDVVFMHVPDYDADGRLKVWLNCADWANCTPIVNHSGPTSIFDFTDRYWKGGLYEMNIAQYDRAIAQYVDSHKMGKKDGETEAQMLALMSDVFTSDSGGGDGGGGTSVASNLVINGGAVVDSNQDPINFTVSDVYDITNCVIGNTPYGVKFDYVNANAGKFAGPDTTGFSSTGEVKCYNEDFINNPTMSGVNMTEVNVVDSSQTSLDHWGYTSGRRIYKAASDSGEAYWAYGSAYNTVVGDRARFDITYSCTGDSCENMYFDIMHNVTTTGDKRVRLSGTAGSLVAGQAASVALHGSNYFVRNYTLPDNTYRVVFWFTVTESNNYRIRAGWTSASAAALTMDILEFVMRKNWTTTELTAPILYGVVDTTAPILSGCALGNNPSVDGEYKAYIGCTADEIGGTDYAIITTTNTAPDEAAMKAGTSTDSIWSSQKSADTTEIAFEASGMIYQDLWSWIMRCDAATVTNCSAVVGASFSDGLAPGQVKKIKFAASTKLFKSGGTDFNGTIDEFTLYDSDPLRAPSIGRGQGLVEWRNVKVGTAAEPALTPGTFDLTDAMVYFGSLNSLSLGTYYYTAYTFTGGTYKFSSGTIDLIAE